MTVGTVRSAPGCGQCPGRHRHARLRRASCLCKLTACLNLASQVSGDPGSANNTWWSVTP